MKMTKANKMKQKTFSVLGCGWLGLPLAEAFVKEGYRVKGSSTSVSKYETLLEKDIQPYILSIDDEIDGNLNHFLQADILFINVPFRKQKPFLESYKKLVKQIEKSTIKHVIFISSTSVYADINNEIITTENFSINPAKEALLTFEELFKNNAHFNTTIIRFAGLIGGTRNPGNFFKEDKQVANGLSPINLIHLEDCIAIVKTIVAKKKWNVIYNAAANTHPTKTSYYTKATQQMGKKPATFVNELTNFKIISNQKMVDDLEYQFVYPDLIESLTVFIDD